MRTQRTPVALATVVLDPSSPVPLYRQLYHGLRQAILGGQFRPGAALPSTRTLADDLRVSRTTVVMAYEQLLAEGYLEGRVGSGTYVAQVVPDEALQVHGQRLAQPSPAHAERSLSQRGRLLAATPTSDGRDEGPPRAFQPGIPALDAFPFDLWARLVARRYQHPPRELLGYGDPAGFRPLRQAVAAYLRESRAVRCQAEQVLVVPSTQQALDLAARVLLDPGDAVWVEDPGYLGARGALRGAGAEVVPVPVDEQGLNVAAGIARCPGARMAYVTPSHQYPLGVTMSLPRRLALLEWASQTGAWLLEDDYDSEYRYAGRPLAALQGLDQEGRVIYLGSFSKVLFPSLCLAYLVVPEDLVEAFVAGRALLSRHSPSLEQAALADFITEGHFTRHIRRMRTLYAARQAALVTAAQAQVADWLEVQPHEAGLHLVAWLPPGSDDAAVSRRAAQHGVAAPALSRYSLQPPARPGLLLGYAALDVPEIEAGIQRLAAALASSPEDARA